VGDVGEVGAEPEIYGGEDGEDGDNQLGRQHALPGLHALLAKGRVGGLVLGRIRLGLGFFFSGIGAAATSGCHGGRLWAAGGRMRDVSKSTMLAWVVADVEEMGSHFRFVDADHPAILHVRAGPCSGCGRLQLTSAHVSRSVTRKRWSLVTNQTTDLERLRFPSFLRSFFAGNAGNWAFSFVFHD